MPSYNPDFSPMVDASVRQGQAIAQGLGGLGDQWRERKAEKEAKAEKEKMRGLYTKAMAGDEEAREELAFESPEINAQVMEAFGARDERQQKGLIADAAQVLSLHRAGQPQQVLNYLDQRIAAITARGGDPSHTQQARDIYAQNPEQGAKLIMGELRGMVDVKSFLKDGTAPTKPATDLGNYVTWEVDKWLKANPDKTESDMPPEMKQKAFLEAKRAQAAEVSGTSTARTQAAEKEKKYSTLIGRAVSAAESVPILSRALTLLEDLDTGGIDAVSLRAKKMFGIETADEGELSNLTGKAVLKQLKETFGAQFTEKEGDRLDRLEAGYGKSNAANKRILEQVLKMAKRTVARARKQALKRGEADQVDELDELLEFTLTPVPEGVTEDDITTTMQANNMTREQVLARLAGK